jgi:hypothetical protein
MYGVSKDLPLQRFVGDSICQICLGLRDIHFHFNKAGSINVDGGRWQIHDSSGVIVDESLDDDALPSTRRQYRVHVILDSDVTSFRIDAPESFTLRFSSGHTLTIYDDSPQYESFSIQPDDLIA